MAKFDYNLIFTFIFIMKKYTFFIFTFFCISYVLAQKHDNNWVFGYDSGGQHFGGSIFNFTADSVFYYPQLGVDMGENNVSMSDRNGNLIFYTNGESIANALHDTLWNGKGINPGAVNNDYAPTGAPVPFGAICLPMPGDTNLYYLFSEKMEYYPNIPTFVQASQLTYSVIDMRLDNGKGGVVLGKKNISIINDTLTSGQLSAVKHGNGRDWWIIIPEFHTKAYYRFLLTPKGIQGPFKQYVAGTPTILTDWSGNVAFSQDGSKYARYDKTELLTLMDFDRCTGLFSNPQKLNVYPAPNGVMGGVMFSPNGKYLYVAIQTFAVQYDLTATDINASMDTVAIYDGFVSPFSTDFLYPAMGPDGKIYYNGTGGIDKLHVIEYPDSGGSACYFHQHAISLPTYNYSSIPNFPNYRLGALVGSACDTIFATAIETPITSAFEVILSPNPAQNHLFLQFSKPLQAEAYIAFFEATGKKVAEYPLEKGHFDAKLNISALANGIYFYRLYEEGKGIGSGKLVVQR